MPKLKVLPKDKFMTSKTSKEAPKNMSQREKTHRRYCRYLEKLDKSAYVEVTLKSSENKVTHRNRLMRAAKDWGLKLAFKRTRGEIRFQMK